MPLTPEEQQELAQLEAQFAGQQQRPPSTGVKMYSDAGKQAMDAAKQMQSGQYGPPQPPQGLPEENEAANNAVKMLYSAQPQSVTTGLADLLTKGKGFFGGLRNIGATAATGAAQGGLAPGQTPDQRVRSAATGAAIGGGVGALAQAGSGLKALFKMASEKASGLSPASAEAYIDNPSAVSDFAKSIRGNDKRSISGNLQDEMTTAGDVMGKQASDLSAQRAAFLEPHQIPASSIPSGIDPDVDAILKTAKNGMVDGNSAQEALQKLSDIAKYRPNELVTDSSQATKKVAGDAANSLRNQIRGLDPEIQPINSALQSGINNQKALTKGFTSPRSFVTSDAKNDVVQNIDEATGSKLGEMGRQYSAAKEMSTPAGGLIDRTIVEPLGRVGLRASGAADAVGSALNAPSQQATLRGLIQPPSSVLSPSEQAEKDQLESQVGHLLK